MTHDAPSSSGKQSTERPVLDILQRIGGPPEAVFDAWLDPELLTEWFCGSGTRVTEVSLDPRVGGSYRIIMSNSDRAWPHSGVYREIDRPRRLVFTWATPSTDHRETLVTVTLAPDPAGTLLRLVHERLPETTWEGHRAGWLELFGQLDQAIRQ